MAERPTPLSIGVCTLIALHSDPTSAYHEINRDESSKRGLLRLLNEVVCGGGAGLDQKGSVLPFVLQVESAAGPETSSLLLEYVEMSVSSIDALVDLIASLQNAVAECVVDGSSAYGAYVRKTCLGFDELSFEAMTRLWQALKDEIESGVRDGAITDESKSEPSHSPWSLSPRQIEAQLRKQCLEMDSFSDQHSFEDTELQLQDILACDPELPAAHFLRFLNCLRHGERVGAMDALHQYFDYAMIKERKEAASSTRTAKHDILHYAAILLALVHHSFGDDNLSLKATEEAVRVAQQSGDSACVAYALGWLYCNQTGFDSEEILRKCSLRASSHRPLMAGVHMSLARHFLSEQSNAPALQAWEALLGASTDRPNTSTTGMDRPTHLEEFCSSQDVMAVLTRQVLVGAGIWESLGLNAMSGLSSFVALHCYSEYMTRQDSSSAIQNIARAALCGSATVASSFDRNGNDLAGLMETLGNQKIADEDISSCRYATSLRHLMKIQDMERQPAEYLNVVTLVLHEWAVRRGDLGHAEYLMGILQSHLHPRMPNFRAATIETLSQYVMLLCRQGQWEKAQILSKQICDACQKEGLRTQHATALIQLALIKLESSPHDFIGALPPLLDALSLCERINMDSHHATALSVLAQVHLRLGNVKRAKALLKATLPSLLKNTNVWFAGEAYLTIAKCHLYRAKENMTKERTLVVRILRSACRFLEKSCKMFEECQGAVRLREVYYLLARTYHSIPGQTEKRNEASKRFLKVSRHLTKHSRPACKVGWSSSMEELASRRIF